jgi:hypothetical protein
VVFDILRAPKRRKHVQMVLEWCTFGALAGATMDGDNFFRRIAASFVLLVVFWLVYFLLLCLGVVR